MASIRYVNIAQDPISPDDTQPAGPDGILYVQQVEGGILYYARAVNMTALTELTTLGREQAKATTNTMKGTDNFLDFYPPIPIPK